MEHKLEIADDQPAESFLDVNKRVELGWDETDARLGKGWEAREHLPARSHPELRARLYLGWDYSDASRGKGWRERFPHLASWQGGLQLFCSNGVLQISLRAYADSPFVGQREYIGRHGTEYILHEKSVPVNDKQDELQKVDEVICEWLETHGADAILPYKKGWMGEPDWEQKYTHIVNWIKRSKRHCLTVRINLVTQESHIKAWHYDKPTNSETVLIEKNLCGVPEADAIGALDEGIARWLSENQDTVLLKP